jgi:hypothetical protein
MNSVLEQEELATFLASVVLYSKFGFLTFAPH